MRVIPGNTKILLDMQFSFCSSHPSDDFCSRHELHVLCACWVCAVCALRAALQLWLGKFSFFLTINIYILKLLYFNTFQRTHNYPNWFWCATLTTDSWIIRVYELAHERVLHIFFQVTDWFERDTLRPSYRHAPIYHEDIAIKIVWPTLSYLWVLCLQRSVMQGTVGLYNLVWPVSRFRGCCL